MKKSIVAILLSAILSFTLFAFCGCSPEELGGGNTKYKLTVTGATDMLYEVPNEAYKVGETVTVKTHIIYDADITAKLNGTPLWYDAVKEDGRYHHLEFTFIMPKRDSILDLKITGGFLPSPVTIKSTVAYYDLALTSDREVAGLKMNAYVESVTVWEQIKPLIPKFTKSYDDEYFRTNSLLVFFGEKGDGGGGTLKEAKVTVNDWKLYVDLIAEYGTGDVPDVMTEWVVVLEIENNIGFSEIIVNAQI